MLTVKTAKTFTLLLLLFNLTLLTSCYKEAIIGEASPEGGLNFNMPVEQEQAIYNAYNEKLEIEPEPLLFYNNQEFEVDDFELRGESALRFRKKSFNVRTTVPIEFTNFNFSENSAALRNIKLISLVSDYTYIENIIAFELFKKVNIQPLFYTFKEVSLNNNTQGLYLLIESPAEYLLKQNYECLLRRGRNGSIADSWFYANFSGNNETNYTQEFNNIYDAITIYKGQQLYDSLKTRMNISNYLRKTAIDMLLQNGDTSDEIYFIATNTGTSIYFDIIPWDCDDMFSELPHEIGRNYAMGTRFGERSYNSMNDIIDDIGNKLIFSIEDDLDYIIAKDTLLYKKYLVELDYVLNEIDETVIDQLFADTRDELTPYLNNNKIIEQTIHCVDAFTFNDFDKNIEEKREWTKQQRNSLINKLKEHKLLYE